MLIDLPAEPLGGGAVPEVVTAGVGGDGETGRHRQPQVGHLGQVGALAAQQVLKVLVSLGEVVDELRHAAHSSRCHLAGLQRPAGQADCVISASRPSAPTLPSVAPGRRLGRTQPCPESTAFQAADPRDVASQEYERQSARLRAGTHGLVRLAYVMLGSRQAAEDVVQEAFLGLYRNWGRLADTSRALPYVRSSVLNGCRSVLRRGRAGRTSAPPDIPAESAEAAALTADEHRAVMRAIRRLPDRQREALVLRFYLDLSDAQIAADMGISAGTVRSTIYRALAALGQMLGTSS